MFSVRTLTRFIATRRKPAVSARRGRSGPRPGSSLDFDLVVGGLSDAFRHALFAVHAEPLLAVDLGGRLAVGLGLFAFAFLVGTGHRLELVERLVAERLRATWPLALSTIGVDGALLCFVQNVERVSAELVALFFIELSGARHCGDDDDGDDEESRDWANQHAPLLSCPI